MQWQSLYFSRQVCSVCGYRGAMIGCFTKSCDRKYHYLCARNDKCHFDESNYFVYCVKHQVRATYYYSKYRYRKLMAIQSLGYYSVAIKLECACTCH